MVSKKLKDAVRTSDMPAYVIAQEVGMHPSMLSQIINELIRINDNDSRVIAIGRVLGVKAGECFEAGQGK